MFTTVEEIKDFFQEKVISDVDFEFKTLIDNKFDKLPFPGYGATLERWKVLAAVAERNLSLAKLYEGHTDALFILHEIFQYVPLEKSRWGVWCAEPPNAKLNIINTKDSGIRLLGKKAWCSGAEIVTHALVSCWDQNQPCIAAVELNQENIKITSKGWHAVGMAESKSVEVEFNHAIVDKKSLPNAYLTRAGFWQGGAGIAACWYGGATAIAQQLRTSLVGHKNDFSKQAYALAYLGKADVILSAAAALLRESAVFIDQNPEKNAMAFALRCRLAVEFAASQILTSVTRALGAGPLCHDEKFAKMCADLPVFIRQSHAEKDLAALAEKNLSAETPSWIL